MPKKKLKNPFNLIKSTIRKEKVINPVQRTGFVPVSKGKVADEDVVIKRAMSKRVLSEGSFDNNLINKTKQRVINAQRVWKAFYRAGLPVPKFSKLDLRFKINKKYNENFLTRYMQDVSKLGLKPVHNSSGRPVFLKNLNINEHGGLIKNLASDLAKMHNLGFIPDDVNFWYFYKNGKKIQRLILNFEDFKNYNKKQAHSINQARKMTKEQLMNSNLFDILRNTSKQVFNKFIKKYFDELSSENKKHVESQYKQGMRD